MTESELSSSVGVSEAEQLKVLTSAEMLSEGALASQQIRDEVSRFLSEIAESQLALKDTDSSESQAELDQLHRLAQVVEIETLQDVEGIVNGHYLSSMLHSPEQFSRLDERGIRLEFEQMKAWRSRQKEFRERLKVLREPSLSDDEKVIEIFRQFRESPFTIEELTSEELAALFQEFKDLGAFSAMLLLYSQGKGLEFKLSPVVREGVATALHRVGREEDSKSFTANLIAQGRTTGQAYGCLGGIYARQGHAMLEEGKAEEGMATIDESIGILEDGFEQTLERFPGIYLMSNLLFKADRLADEGNESEAKASVSRATDVARMVYISTLKTGGEWSNDFWTLADMIQTGLLTGEDIEPALREVAHIEDVASWQLHYPIEVLKNIIEYTHKHPELFKDAERLAQTASVALSSLEARFEGRVEREPLTADYEGGMNLAQATRTIFNSGFHYGELNTFISGNIEYGGQLHSHSVSENDVTIARSILAELDINQVDDFATFNRTVDAFLRERFLTFGLEDLKSEDHKVYDAQVKAINVMMDVQKGDDSRTNIMVDFWLGRGDCRQHAYIKQLFFDVWKSDRVNRALHRAYDSLNNGDNERFHACIEEARGLTRVHTLVLDAAVKASIQMHEKYEPVMLDGNLVYDDDAASNGQENVIEDHTLNVLAVLDDSGISDFYLIDSFYQHTYQFGVSSTARADEFGVVLNPLDILHKGLTGSLLQAQRQGPSGVTEIVEVPTYLVPTRHAGNRIKRAKQNKDELGHDLRFRGRRIKGLPLNDQGQPDVSSYFDFAGLQRIHAGLNKIVEHADSLHAPPTLTDSEVSP